MKKLLCLLAICLFLNVGQAKAGVLLTDTLEPLLISNSTVEDFSKLKSGSESIVHILGLYTSGFAGIYTIAANNGIHKIHYVDIKKRIFLGIGTTTVIVYGE